MSRSELAAAASARASCAHAAAICAAAATAQASDSAGCSVIVASVAVLNVRRQSEPGNLSQDSAAGGAGAAGTDAGYFVGGGETGAVPASPTSTWH